MFASLRRGPSPPARWLNWGSMPPRVSRARPLAPKKQPVQEVRRAPLAPYCVVAPTTSTPRCREQRRQSIEDVWK